MFKSIKKRNGQIAPFSADKITNAIYKASVAVGEQNWQMVISLAKEIIERLNKKIKKGALPDVEEVQDMVEAVLIESGKARIAKAYILYRQHRAEIRNEKKQILNKEEIDEVDKKFDTNALRVLASRYLKKNEDGEVIESVKELFERVAVHATIPSIFYDKKIYVKNGKAPERAIEDFDSSKFDKKFSVGKYKFNKFHLEGIKRIYDRFAEQKKIKVSWSGFLNLLKKGYFDKYENETSTYYNLMVNRRFLPNTPAIANFGNYLGMGSACFHPSQLIITKNGVRKISEIKINDEVLSHKGRFRKVKEIFTREINEKIYRIKCFRLPKETLTITKEHPVLIYKNGELNWQPVSSLKKGDFAALSYPKEIIDVSEIRVSDFVSDLEIKDGYVFYKYEGGKFNAFSHCAKKIKNHIKVDKDLMKLFGFYFSEGCVSESRCLRFTLSAQETEIAKEIIRIVKEKFGVSAKIEKTGRLDRNWISLRFHSTILAKFFENIFNTGFDKKIIPHWIITLPYEKQLGLVYGISKEDGTIFKNGNYYNLRTTMCNYDLIYGLWQVLARLNIFSSLTIESIPKLGRKNPVICTICGDNQWFIKALFKNDFQFLKQSRAYFRSPDYERLDDGTILTRIKEIETIDYQGLVYNLEVEEDHSYVANMVSVHNCFVLGVEDSIDSIMDALKAAAIIFKSGGGVGYNFSKLRFAGDFVKTTGGLASGPISFMSMFDNMTDVIKQGGIRRGANMGILNSDHPDIEQFITAKEGNKALRNFNISIMLKSEFWEAIKENKPYLLVNPRTGKTVKEVDAKQLFEMISHHAWESAEPGVLFHDRINEYNPFLKSLGPIECTNPCGEVLLYPKESCNLGSINTWSYLKKNGDKKPHFDWKQLEQDVAIATKFLDNVIDINKYPMPEIEAMTLNTRKLGLGIMGIGDLLYELEIPYASKQGLDFMERIMEFINYYSKLTSIELSRERGRMPYFDKSFYKEGKLPFAGFKDKKLWHFDWGEIAKKIKKFGIRNAFNTVIAPTGSISMITGCSSGIEPVFSLVFEKSVAIGNFYYIDPVFEEKMRKEGLMDEDLIKDTAVLNGSVKNIPYIPEKIKKIFVTAMDISPADHIKVLASFQKWTDSSISKTNNFPAEATVDDIKKAYLMAYELGCKGVTIYRDRSLQSQVLVGGSTKKKPKENVRISLIKDEKAKGLAVYSEAGANIAVSSGSLGLSPVENNGNPTVKNSLKNCPNCNTTLVKQEGCTKCPTCSWGLCV